MGQTSGLPAPRYRGAVIIVLTVAVPLAPQGSRTLRAQADQRFSPSWLKMRYVQVFMLEERVVQKEEHPLLSCKNIEVLLATFLPRRDVDQAEVLMQMRQRHRLRQRAIESHARKNAVKKKMVK